jgi:DNA-binding winged helix-turn-helix (wHTH) protein/Tfp pilus assembly protein PilF/TolB-like protein
MRYEIGNFCLDTSGHRLAAACGSEILLAPKEFETLRLLAERAGEAIPKDTVIQQVWPDVFIGDTSLAKVISNLRKHLGADAIQTVPKVGYRLVLPVKLVPNGLPKPELVPQPAPVSVENANHRRRASDAPNLQPATPVPMPPSSVNRAWPWRRALSLAPVIAICGLTAAWLLHGRTFAGRSDPPARTMPIRLAILPLSAIPETPETVALAQKLDGQILASLSSMADSQVAIVQGGAERPDAAGPEPAEWQKTAATLHADYLLTGRIVSGADSNSLRMELLHGGDGAILWSAEYVEPAKDGDVETPEIVQSIARQVWAKLQAHGEVARPLAGDTAFPQAREAYLRGRYDLGLKTVPGYDQALRDFQDALTSDPKYARAYAGISEAYINLAAGNVPQRPMWEKARQAALVAIRLDDHLAEAHRDLAYLLPTDAAEKEYQRALQLDPNDSRAHGWYAQYLAAQGRSGEALAEARKSLELRPLSLGANCNYALMLIEDAKMDRAIAHLNKLLPSYPDSELVYGYLGLAYARKQQYPQAAQAFHKAMELSTAKVNYEGGYAYTSALAGDDHQARLLLHDLLARYKRHEWVPAYGVALTYLALRDKPDALHWLQLAAQDGTMSAFERNTEPLLAPVKNAPALAQIQSDSPQ